MQPRLVYHIDDGAVAALTKYYKTVLTEGASVLDIASSWYVRAFPLLLIMLLFYLKHLMGHSPTNKLQGFPLPQRFEAGKNSWTWNECI